MKHSFFSLEVRRVDEFELDFVFAFLAILGVEVWREQSSGHGTWAQASSEFHPPCVIWSPWHLRRPWNQKWLSWCTTSRFLIDTQGCWMNSSSCLTSIWFWSPSHITIQALKVFSALGSCSWKPICICKCSLDLHLPCNHVESVWSHFIKETEQYLRGGHSILVRNPEGRQKSRIGQEGTGRAKRVESRMVGPPLSCSYAYCKKRLNPLAFEGLILQGLSMSTCEKSCDSPVFLEMMLSVFLMCFYVAFSGDLLMARVSGQICTDVQLQMLSGGVDFIHWVHLSPVDLQCMGL